MEEVYDFQEDDIGRVILESSEKVGSLANQSSVQINVEGTEFPVAVNLDRGKISRAFINLFSNAIRYAESRVDVLLKHDGSNVYIEFNDDGPGFKEEETERVFERFFVGRKGDTGLGLAITKAIVEKHGGKIKARNNISGASITVVLPRSAKPV
ncbi:MAG: HAMP domain-containing histidine kinase [Firmicutes bacterium]|nr:HAMP domain-containing histidine kinase [Bacillota bacterium]